MSTPDAPQSFADIINLWPTAEALAAEMGEKGVTVRAWRNRDNIDSGYWERLLRAAAERGFHQVTAELLMRLAASRRGSAA